MHTAGLIRLTPSDKSAVSRVNYNLKIKKTTGRWPNDPAYYHQNDLVSFHGLGSLAKTVPSGAHSFLMTTRNGFRTHGLLSYQLKVSQCRTIVQSFDYQANPHLRPVTAHAMANVLYERIDRYLRTRYGYRLDAGMVSTHIDDDKVKPNPNPVSKERVIYPHLHSHILLPAYNTTGQPIYPYLRKADLYQFQQMNDDIVTSFGLRDYYFQKARRLIHPMSAYTLNGVHRQTASDLEKAQQAFEEANQYAWPASRVFNVSPARFRKIRHKRNSYLRVKFNFRTKTTHDVQTDRKEKKFTLDVFSRNALLQTPWYALNNLRLLRWRDYKEARSERLLRCFDFSVVQSRATSFHVYQRTIEMSTIRLRRLIKRKRYTRRVSLRKTLIRVRKSDVKNMRKYDNLNSDEKFERFMRRELAGESLIHGSDRLVGDANRAIASSKTAKDEDSTKRSSARNARTPHIPPAKRSHSRQHGIDIQ